MFLRDLSSPIIWVPPQSTTQALDTFSITTLTVMQGHMPPSVQRERTCQCSPGPADSGPGNRHTESKGHLLLPARLRANTCPLPAMDSRGHGSVYPLRTSNLEQRSLQDGRSQKERSFHRMNPTPLLDPSHLIPSPGPDFSP